MCTVRSVEQGHVIWPSAKEKRERDNRLQPYSMARRESPQEVRCAQHARCELHSFNSFGAELLHLWPRFAKQALKAWDDRMRKLAVLEPNSAEPNKYRATFPPDSDVVYESKGRPEDGGHYLVLLGPPDGRNTTGPKMPKAQCLEQPFDPTRAKEKAICYCSKLATIPAVFNLDGNG